MQRLASIFLVFAAFAVVAFGVSTSVSESQAAGFNHPGVLLNQGQIDFVRAKIAANQQPWKGMLSKLLSNSRGKITYTAAPVSVMTCGQEKPVPTDIGCSRSRQDALAAWTLTLIWTYTGNYSYANAAKNILNAWSSTLTALPFDPSVISTRNGLLQGAWIGEMFTRSAELLKHSNASWAPADVLRFQKMLTNIIGKTIYDGFPGSNGNWDASVADALISIGVFADNGTIFDQGVKIWRKRLPLYFYITSDGSAPHLLPNTNLNTYWNQTVFDSRVNGLCQETCRDFGHTQMGVAAMIQSAETAYHQGLDLYSEAQERFLPAFEFHTHYLNLKNVNVEPFLCRGTIEDLEDKAAWEIGYNHYVNRLGLSLPTTSTLLDRFRVNGPFYNDLNMAWDTLTHAGTGTAGIAPVSENTPDLVTPTAQPSNSPSTSPAGPASSPSTTPVSANTPSTVSSFTSSSSALSSSILLFAGAFLL